METNMFPFKLGIYTIYLSTVKHRIKNENYNIYSHIDIYYNKNVKNNK